MPRTMWTPEEVLGKLASNSLLPDQMFEALDVDAVLEARGDSFDDDWIRAAEEVQAAWEQFPDAGNHAASIDAVREAAFKRTFGASGGNHDLASAISDDFEVICKRALLGLDSPLVGDWEEAYDAGQVPCLCSPE